MNLFERIFAAFKQPAGSIGQARKSCADSDVTEVDLELRHTRKTRLSIVLENKGSGNVSWGAVPNMLAGQGITLEPGGIIELETIAPVYIRNDSGGAITIEMIVFYYQ